MADNSIFDVPARSRDFEPPQMSYRLMSSIDCIPNGVLDAFIRSPYKFDNPIRMARFANRAELPAGRFSRVIASQNRHVGLIILEAHVLSCGLPHAVLGMNIKRCVV